MEYPIRQVGLRYRILLQYEIDLLDIRPFVLIILNTTGKHSMEADILKLTYIKHVLYYICVIYI